MLSLLFSTLTLSVLAGGHGSRQEAIMMQEAALLSEPILPLAPDDLFFDDPLALDGGMDGYGGALLGGGMDGYGGALLAPILDAPTMAYDAAPLLPLPCADDIVPFVEPYVEPIVAPLLPLPCADDIVPFVEPYVEPIVAPFVEPFGPLPCPDALLY